MQKIFMMTGHVSQSDDYFITTCACLYLLGDIHTHQIYMKYVYIWKLKTLMRDLYIWYNDTRIKLINTPSRVKSPTPCTFFWGNNYTKAIWMQMYIFYWITRQLGHPRSPANTTKFCLFWQKNNPPPPPWDQKSEQENGGYIGYRFYRNHLP